MDNQQDKIFLGGEPPEWLGAMLGLQPKVQRGLTLPDGIVIVEMDQSRTSEGSILLPDEASERYRPDTGTVIFENAHSPQLMRGTRVAVYPYAGKWIRNFRLREYRSNGQVRILGRVATVDEGVRRVAWQKQVPLILEPKLTPTGRNVLIRRPKLETSKGGIELPDSEAFRSPTAIVVSRGPDCEYVAPGDKVILLNSAIKRGQVSQIMFGNDPDLAIIHEDGILAIEKP